MVSPGAFCGGCDRALPRLPLGAVTAPRPLAACVAAAAYRGPVEEWVQRFKYPAPGLAGLDPSPGAALRALVCEAAARAPGPPPDLVVPVPLHPHRLRQRGFNPACELARAVARAVGAPLDATALRRVRDTPSQTGLGRRARRRNVRHAFAARPGLEIPAVVWLVDDVVTTGSTLAEAARPLHRAATPHLLALTPAATGTDSPSEQSGSWSPSPVQR